MTHRTAATGSQWSVVRPLSEMRRTGHAVLDLIECARRGLTEAAAATSPGERYVAAHLAALRAGAAVLAARAKPSRAAGRRHGRRGGPRNVWVDLGRVAPELAEWSEVFAAGAAKRAAAQAGLPRAVTERDADDMLREADVFLGQVCGLLGLPHQRPLSGAAVGFAAS